MNRITRRDFVRGALVTTGIGLCRRGSGDGDASPPTSRERLPVLGKVAPRSSISIAASPLSIGFETLDRKMFDPERTYAHVARLGVKWARVHTGWCRTERKRGAYDFAWLDQVVDALRRIGVQLSTPWTW